MTATLTVIPIAAIVTIMVLAEKLRRARSDVKWLDMVCEHQQKVIKQHDYDKRISDAQIRDLKALIATYRERV